VVAESVRNQVYGVVDNETDPVLYQHVLSFISVNGVGESWEIRKSEDPTGVMQLNAEAGLGWHLIDWKGNKIRSLHFERGKRLIAIFFDTGTKEDLLEFFEQCCRETERQQTEDRQQASQPKFWVQELVEAALREEEAQSSNEKIAEEDQGNVRKWSEMPKTEADRFGAKRLGLDFDPLAPSKDA